jgi:hypothetical protein
VGIFAWHLQWFRSNVEIAASVLRTQSSIPIFTWLS